MSMSISLRPNFLQIMARMYPNLGPDDAGFKVSYYPMEDPGVWNGDMWTFPNIIIVDDSKETMTAANIALALGFMPADAFAVLNSDAARTEINAAKEVVVTNKLAAEAALDAIYRAGTITPVDFSSVANFQRVISSISNPDTRYDAAVVAGSFITDLKQAAVLFCGVRLNIVRMGGRIYRVKGAFDSGGTALTTNAGFTLGFDPGVATGANVLLDNAGAGWTWRQNGVLTWTDFNSGGGAGTTNATYAATLVTGAYSSFVPGDVLMLELTESTTGVDGTLRGYKNGALQFTSTVPAIPPGKLVALMRGVGGGNTYPAALRMNFYGLHASDPIQAPIITNINVASSIVSSIITTPGLGRAQSLSPVRDASAFLQRVKPLGFEWLPITPSVVSGPGDVLTSTPLITSLFAAYPALQTGTVAYVETTGNNTTGRVGDATKPYLTIDAALQTTARIVVMGDGVFGVPPDYRFTQGAAGVMKLVMARNRGRTIIRQPGDNLSTNTFVATVGFSALYQTTIAAAAGQASWLAFAPHRIRFTDTLDEFGFPERLPYFAPPTLDAAGITAAKTALQAAGYGWTYDGLNGNKVLYVALSGANVQTNRTRLQGVYYNSGGTSRVFISGANLAFDGIYFDSQLIWPLEYNNTGVYVSSSIWLTNCWLINSPSYGVQGDSNTFSFLDNCRIHGSGSDGLNSDSTRGGSGAVANALLAGCFISSSGDVNGFGIGVSQNRQAISSHAGYLAAFGCLFEKNWGQEIADTGLGTGPSKSWYVGCVARNGDTRLGLRVGFGFYDVRRQAWLDTCVGLAEGVNPLRIEGGANVRTFNCLFDAPTTVIAPSTTPALYTPDAP